MGQSYPNPLGSGCWQKLVIPIFLEGATKRIKKPRVGGLSYDIINNNPGPKSDHETLGHIKTHIHGFEAKTVPLSTSWGQS